MDPPGGLLCNKLADPPITNLASIVAIHIAVELEQNFSTLSVNATL